MKAEEYGNERNQFTEYREIICTRLLFTDVSITFTDQKRLGLVGINGTGKSTFLKILTGQMESDKGTIERNGKATIHYLAQTPVLMKGIPC